MTGWQKINGESYYFHTDGRMLTGWLNDSAGNRYYMSTVSGRMIRGWREIDQHWYFFNSSGYMVKGWLKENNSYYYLDPSSGVMASDCSKVISNVTYTFTKNGACQTNTNLIQGAVQADHLASNNSSGSAPGTSSPNGGSGPSGSASTETGSPSGNSGSGATQIPGGSSGSGEAQTPGGNSAPGSSSYPGSSSPNESQNPGSHAAPSGNSSSSDQHYSIEEGLTGGPGR